MISLLYSSNMLMIIFFLLADHPLSMGFILLTQTLIIAMATGIMSMNFWFAYILFIIMVGGMLILFIYMTSVASNEKFSSSNSMIMYLFLIIFMNIFFLMYDKTSLYQFQKSIDMTMLSETPMHFLSMSKYINLPLSPWMMVIIVYLLMALIAVVKISNITYGPLRQKN